METKAQHTPGPWRNHDFKDKRHNEYAVMSETGHQDDGGAVKVCSVWAGRKNHVGWAVGEANARLIAAAPELLDELRSILTNYRTDGASDSRGGVTLSRAREMRIEHLIAKAEGK